MLLEKVNVSGKEIAVLGVMHIGQESKEHVLLALETFKPEAVAIELDEQRLLYLLDPKRFDNEKFLDAIKKGNAFLLLINALLSSLQKKLGEKYNSVPGSEMLFAYKLAKEKNLKVILADMPLSKALQRAFSSMSLTEKAKFLSFLLFSIAEKTKEEDVEKLIEELKKETAIDFAIKQLSNEFPSLKKVLLDERNEFIVRKVLSEKKKKILLVVGKGHVKGIINLLKSKKTLFNKSLENKTETKNALLSKNLNILKSSLPLIFILFLFYFVYSIKGFEGLKEATIIWLTTNVLLTSIFALIARAKLPTIIISAIASPITSLVPYISAGIIAGLIEFKLEQPKIKDLKNLAKIEGIDDIFKNRFLHILTIVVLTNLGSFIASIVAFALIGTKAF